MAHSVVPVSDFGGLDLTSSASSSACIDMLNCDLNVRGAVRSRDGFDNFTTASIAGDYYTGLGYRVTGGQIVAGTAAGDIKAHNSSGAVLATSATGGNSTPAFTAFGTSSAEYVYGGPSNRTIRRWDGAAFTTPTATVDGVAALAMPMGRLLVTSPIDNRLAVVTESGAVGPNGVNSTKSHVWFSAAGNAESYTSTDFVRLTPNDGEEISALVAWRELIFAFKQRRFFVFSAPSIDGTGGAVFNYRPVETGVGAVVSSMGPTACAAPDGVYFVGNAGVYRTTGGPPQLVSREIDPLFIGGTSSFYLGSELNVSSSSQRPAIAFHNERIYVACAAGAAASNNRILVHDPRGPSPYWLLWNGLTANSLLSADLGAQRKELFFSGQGDLVGHIYRHSPSYTTDDGTAIVSRYRTGFRDFGAPGIEKRVVRARLVGTGAVNHTGSRDFGALGTAQSATLGTSPAVDDVRVSGTERPGLSYSFELGASSGAWTVHDVFQEVDLLEEGRRTP